MSTGPEGLLLSSRPQETAATDSTAQRRRGKRVKVAGERRVEGNFPPPFNEEQQRDSSPNRREKRRGTTRHSTAAFLGRSLLPQAATDTWSLPLSFVALLLLRP